MRLKANSLTRHIVRQIQNKHLDHVGDADQGAQDGCAREDQQQSACDFGEAAKDLISRGCADGVPEQRQGRERAERLQQPGQ